MKNINVFFSRIYATQNKDRFKRDASKETQSNEQTNEISTKSDEQTNKNLKEDKLYVFNSNASNRTSRQSRKFCDQGGVFCMLYKAINGEPILSQSSSSSQLPIERRDEVPNPHPRYEGPPTPCPAKVEYATPVFAKNYQGIWRYVVQIPYEGYFTQTVEVTR